MNDWIKIWDYYESPTREQFMAAWARLSGKPKPIRMTGTWSKSYTDLLYDDGLTYAERELLNIILHLTSNYGYCDAKDRTLAGLTHRTERQLKKVLKALVDKGYLITNNKTRGREISEGPSVTCFPAIVKDLQSSRAAYPKRKRQEQAKRRGKHKGKD